MKSWLPSILCALSWCVASTFGASSIEKREMNPQQQQPQPQQSGGYTTMYSAYGDNGGLVGMDRQPPGLIGGNYMQAAPSQVQPNYMPPPYALSPPGNYGPPPPQYGIQQQGYGQQPQTYSGNTGSYSDPGFSMQTGFEGFLVPNPWYGLLPWGLEGGVVIVIAVIVFIIVKIAIIFLLLKIFKIGKLFKDEEDDEGGIMRSYMPSYLNKENLVKLATSVFEAIDRYNDIEEKEE